MRPNIVFLFSDQQRPDTLGCYNSEIPFTPNLDTLAANGVRFENAYTCQPVCGPARACLQTGMYATQVGCYRNNIALPREADTLAKQFSQNGYETAYIGKWHLASNGGDSNDIAIGSHFDYRIKPVPPALRGGYRDMWLAADTLEFTSDSQKGHFFDKEGKQVDFVGYRVDRQTDFVIDYLKKRSAQKPLFLFVSYLEPHHQNTAQHFEGPIGSKETYQDIPIPKDLRAFDGDWETEYADYLGCCASLDQNVGRIVDCLAQRGMLENTLFVYTSDHGCHFKTRNSEYKRSCHDSSIHIPLILNGPGFRGGKTVADIVSLLDLPATLLQEAGIAVPSQMSSRPLQPLVSGEQDHWEQEILIQISESQVGRALRTKKWKYSVSAPDKNGWADAFAAQYREAFLYDLEKDPHEFHNLVLDPAYEQVRCALRARLIKRMTDIGEPEPVILPANTSERR